MFSVWTLKGTSDVHFSQVDCTANPRGFFILVGNQAAGNVIIYFFQIKSFQSLFTLFIASDPNHICASRHNQLVYMSCFGFTQGILDLQISALSCHSAELPITQEELRDGRNCFI